MGIRVFEKETKCMVQITEKAMVNHMLENSTSKENPNQKLQNLDRKSTRLNSSHSQQSRMPSSA